jgi:hypothetical protein
MRTVFVAYAFREPEHALAASVERLLASHNLRAVTGKSLGGQAITPEVQARIDKADGLIALLTRRDRLAGGGWTTHDWVKDELAYARGKGKSAIALLEEGVDPAGAYGQNEYIPLDRANAAEALLRLSETIGEWKRRAGRTLKVQILPDDLAAALSGADGVECRYRFVEEGTPHPWQTAQLIPEAGGAFIYLRGAQDEHLVMVEIVRADQKRWYSVATSQHLPINMRPRE